MTITGVSDPLAIMRQMPLDQLRGIIGNVLQAMTEVHKVALPPALLDELDEALIEHDARHNPAAMVRHLAEAEAELYGPAPAPTNVLALSTARKPRIRIAFRDEIMPALGRLHTELDRIVKSKDDQS